ncbi:MAG: replication initiator protein [Microvirus sp.]|nr:MAG: replication initiator protein [Microvirus sp.]
MLFFWAKAGTEPIKVKCGQCHGCRLERSRVWAARCVHEAQMHDDNSFITLTYKDAPASLRYVDFQLFMKRLRKRVGPVRFFMCGEYGEMNERPHFHAIIFGFGFRDRSRLSGGVFRSGLLDGLWCHGFASVGDVSFESAAYVARYVMKKVNGDLADKHYEYVDSDGVVQHRVPEFCHMSLKPGVGAKWLGKFMSDVYPDGKMVVRGVESMSARYYDKLFARADEVGYERLKAEREFEGQERWKESEPDRLAAREAVSLARIRSLKRSI